MTRQPISLPHSLPHSLRRAPRGIARLLPVLLGTLLGASIGACVDGDLTLDDDCEQDGDCLGSQVCLTTPYQEMRDEFGWCRDDGECAAGAQPGCRCAAGFCNVGNESLVAVRVDCVFATEMALDMCIEEGIDEFMPDDCVCVRPPTSGG